MLHLTLCGPYAGRPLCDCDRQEIDTYVHAAYVTDETLKSADLCDVCLTYWETADEEDDTVVPKIVEAIRRQKAAERLAAGEQTLPFE